MNISIPEKVWLAAAVVLSIFVAFKLGQRDVRAEWEESIARGRETVEALKQEADKITVVVEERVEYRDRIIEKAGEERVVTREVFVPIDSGFLPGGFRLYHDAAATSSIPDPSRIVDAAPTAITDVAATVDSNYQKCHKAYARVEEWQAWAEGMCTVWEEARARTKSGKKGGPTAQARCAL